MPKLTAQQAVSLLAAAGYQGVELAEAGDPDFNQDTALQAIDTHRTTFIKPRIVSELKDSIHGEQMAKLNKALRVKLSTLTGAEMEKLETEKDTDKMLELSINTLSESLKKDIGKDKQAWISERDELLKAHNANLQAKESEWAQKHSALEQQIQSQYVHAALSKLHKEAKGLPVAANRETLAKDYAAYLQSLAVVKHNPETNELELYDAKNPEQRLYNETKTAFAKPEDFMEKRYGKDGLGIWNTDTRTVNPAQAMGNPNGGNPNPAPAAGTQAGLAKQVDAFAEWAGAAK